MRQVITASEPPVPETDSVAAPPRPPSRIAEIVARWTGVPVARLLEGEQEKLLRLDSILHERVIGQDEAVQAVDRRVKPASRADWSTEYLDAILTVGVVDGVDAAIAHIERYGSHHTDAIITEDKKAAGKFLREVDSAIVLHNASTQFADGGEFGFGAEIGIATGRLHARGPVGVEQLTSFKYRIRGSGQTRP